MNADEILTPATRVQFQKGHDSGWTESPVLLVLETVAPEAMAVAEALLGEPPPTQNTDSLAYLVRRSVVCQLLRECCNTGGEVVANHLEDQAMADLFGWSVTLITDYLEFKGWYQDGHLIVGGRVGYDTDPRNCPPPSQQFDDDTPTSWPVVLDDGTRIRLFAKDGATGALAATLFHGVVNRELNIPHGGKTHTVKLTDAGLADMLLKAYGKPDEAAPVIVCCLHGLAHLGDKGKRPRRWLLGVLHGQPELRELSLAVDRELHG